MVMSCAWNLFAVRDVVGSSYRTGPSRTLSGTALSSAEKELDRTRRLRLAGQQEKQIRTNAKSAGSRMSPRTSTPTIARFFVGIGLPSGTLLTENAPKQPVVKKRSSGLGTARLISGDCVRGATWQPPYEPFAAPAAATSGVTDTSATTSRDAAQSKNIASSWNAISDAGSSRTRLCITGTGGATTTASRTSSCGSRGILRVRRLKTSRRSWSGITVRPWRLRCEPDPMSAHEFTGSPRKRVSSLREAFGLFVGGGRGPVAPAIHHRARENTR
jgi:hypothetical protein